MSRRHPLFVVCATIMLLVGGAVLIDAMDILGAPIRASLWWLFP